MTNCIEPERPLIPALAELAALPQWVAHTTSKVPMGRGGKPASSTDPKTWDTLDGAKLLRTELGLAGVGFVMTENDPYVGVDLDNAIDEHGQIKPWADEIVRELWSYTELSPSGRGLHIWLRAKNGLPPGRRAVKVEDGKLEIYDRGRYFTMTGRHLVGGPEEITDAGLWLKYWHADRFGTPAPASGGMPDLEVEWPELEDWIGEALRHIPAEDYEVWVHVGMGLKDELGDRGLHHWNEWSKSATNYGGEQQILNKWRSFDAGGGITIGTVIKYAQDNGFTQPPPRVVNPLQDFDWAGFIARSEGSPEPADETEPARTRFFFAEEGLRDFQPRDYLIGPDVLGARDILVVAGPPKSMKSFLVLDMLCHFSCGKEWRGMRPQRPLKSLLVNLELHEQALMERIRGLAVQPAPGTLLLSERRRTQMDEAFVREAKKAADRAGGVDLVVIDPLANVFVGENENDNAQMTRFLELMNKFRGFIHPEAALVIVHHSNKTPADRRQRDPFLAIRGASALRGYYDAGIAVSRDGKGQISLNFELRNGPEILPQTVRYAAGSFVDADDPIRGKILAIVEEDLARRAPKTINAFAKEWAGRGGLPKQTALTAKVNSMVALGDLALVRALGGRSAHGNSTGFLVLGDAENPSDEP